MMVIAGLAAGLITTVAGMGGGMMLVLFLSAWSADPLYAVAVTTPALLVGNAQRLWMFRRDLSWSVGGVFVGGALPGAFLGGFLAIAVPPLWIQIAMAGAAGVAVAKHLGLLKIVIRSSVLAPAGFGIGVASTAGGAGLLAGPLLLSAGLSGSAYLATMSLSSLSMHAGRLLAFGAGGLVDRSLLGTAAVLAIAITVGNTAGRWVRQQVRERTIHHLEVATAAALVCVSVLGLARVAGA